jgi:phage tail-like protein
MPISGNNSTATAKRVDPFPTFKFHVALGDLTEVFPYIEGGNNYFIHKFPVRTSFENVTLKRGFTLSNELYNWYREMEDALRQGKAFKFRNVTITLRTTVNQEETMRWTLEKAFPVKWVGPSFNSGEAAVAIETLEFAHHGIKVQ